MFYFFKKERWTCEAHLERGLLRGLCLFGRYLEQYGPAEQELLGDLDQFLADMFLQEDDSSALPACVEVWHEAAVCVSGSGYGELTEQGAYQTMELFLRD